VVRSTIGMMVALAVLGCGAEPTFVEFAELCGEAGPVRVLELAPGQRLSRRPQWVAERVVFAVGTAAAGEAKEPTPATVATEAVWTTGPCGEAPRQVAGAVDTVFTIAQWPGVLLACDAAAGEVLALDPEGASPPHALFTGLTDCGGLNWTAHGLVTVAAIDEDEDSQEDEEGAEPGLQRLLMHPYPADPYRDVVEAAPLLEAVRTLSREGLATGQQMAVFPEFVLALTADDALVRVALADGAVSTVQTGVAGFVADDEGRYLLWQDATPTNDNPDYPAGRLFLRDRDDSTDVFLGQGVLAFNPSPLRYIARGDLFLELEAIRVFSVPDMGFTDLPDLGRVTARLDERRWLMAGKGMLNLVDRISGEATLLYRGSGDLLRLLDDGVDLLRVQSCCQRSTMRAEGPLWFVPFEGEARQLAARASRFGHTLKDGRRVVTVDIGGDWRGTLLLTDPETQEALRIDSGAFAQSFAVSKAFGDDVVVYSIPGGSRAGVWIARMPAAAESP
jgi:hypothetical protein